MTSQEPTEAVAKAMADIDDAFKSAAAAIETDADPERAFRLATEVTEALRERTTDAANLRVLAAARVFEAGSMSLAGLAGRIGVSKARAAQLIRSSKQGSDVPAEREEGTLGG